MFFLLFILELHYNFLLPAELAGLYLFSASGISVNSLLAAAGALPKVYGRRRCST